ncbi:hypothetical protein QNI22_20265 [Cytophagaceae bacterium BD1B2-1]|uniref:DUF3885 domain-containing protein n=1 Tax=Xanthocytophaga agilis TaxID=3048010 RepID=A0AAE3R4H1_9BACT|nr:hypothetical protein [Xanthocytophaga agilis]
MGEGNPVLLITGDYIEKGTTSYILEETEVLKPYNFTWLDDIDFHKIDPANYQPNQVYKPALAETVWQSGRHNTLLQAIANDEMRAFFISIERTSMVAPYDGGMDFILKDIQTRDSYKLKYKAWLSKRQDGF